MTRRRAVVVKVHRWQACQAPRDANDLVRLLELVQDVDVVSGAALLLCGRPRANDGGGRLRRLCH